MKLIFSKNYFALFLLAFGLIIQTNLFSAAAAAKINCDALGYNLNDNLYTQFTKTNFKDDNLFKQIIAEVKKVESTGFRSHAADPACQALVVVVDTIKKEIDMVRPVVPPGPTPAQVKAELIKEGMEKFISGVSLDEILKDINIPAIAANKNTLLMIAVNQGRPDLAKMLLAYGADPDQGNIAKQTAALRAQGKKGFEFMPAPGKPKEPKK